MIINGKALLEAAPIVNMFAEKQHIHGTSYGLGEVGYDIRIKQDIRIVPRADGTCVISVLEPNKSKAKLTPGRFILASAIEEFDMPTKLGGVVHDKSTWARKGLSVFNTVIEPGWKGFLTLELVYHGSEDLHIPAGSGIAQVLFHQTIHAASYDGKYQNQADEPVPAKAGTFCSECGAEQFNSPSGITCKNGHGGAEPAKSLSLGSAEGPVKLWDASGVYPSNLDVAVQQQCNHHWEYSLYHGTTVCTKCGYEKL